MITKILLIGLIIFLVMIPHSIRDVSVPTKPPTLSEVYWQKPFWHYSRPTKYRDQATASGVRHRYSTKKEAGTAAVPSWIPEGSVLVLLIKDEYRAYVAVDNGPAVESGLAARLLGKNKFEKEALVVDLYAKKQNWEDFQNIKIYYYQYQTPFRSLSDSEKKEIFRLAVKIMKEDN